MSVTSIKHQVNGFLEQNAIVSRKILILIWTNVVKKRVFGSLMDRGHLTPAQIACSKLDQLQFN